MNGKISYINKPLIQYRQHKENSIGSKRNCSYGKAELSGICEEIYEVHSEERIAAYE